MDSHYVYMVECSDGTLYTGYARNVAKRMDAHNTGRGAKYTRGRRPVRLVYVECFPGKSPALQREYELKRMSRSQKLELIKENPSATLISTE